MLQLETVGEPFKFGRNRGMFQTVVANCPICKQSHLWARTMPGRSRPFAYVCPACRYTTPSALPPLHHDRATCSVCQSHDHPKET